MRKIIIGFGVIIFLSIIFVGWLWYQSRSAVALSIELTVPDQVQIGIPFPVSVGVSNDGSHVLQNTTLALNLPEDVVFIGQSANQSVQTKDVGSLGAQGLIKEDFQLMAVSGANTLKPIRATVSYQPVSLGSRFEKTESKDVAVGESGIFIDLQTPEKVFSGEDFEAKVTYRNDSQIDFSNLTLKIQYPPSFNFKSSSLAADVENNTWNLGDLRRGSNGNFTIKGSLTGPDNALFDFHLILTANFFGNTYKVNEKIASLSIASSPLSLSIGLNDSPSYIAKTGDALNYTLTYNNNTDVGLRDVVLLAKLNGDLYDFSTFNSDTGSLRASDNTVVWNASRLSSFSTIAPGDSGTVTFRINLKKDFAITRVSDKNYTLKLSGTITSPTVPHGVTASQTIGQAELETKVAGVLSAKTAGFFRDASSGILNKGTFPPKVGQATQFTIHWILTNAATDVDGVTVKATLGPNVRYTGVAKVNAGLTPVYNDRTQEISWTIDRIAANRGVINSPVEATFQVELVPSADQAGKFPVLVNQTAVEAHDSFTDQKVSVEAPQLDTSIPDDKTVQSQSGYVQQ